VLEENQHAEARRQVAEERLRIARDIHDIVGHSLASISVLASAGLRVFDDEPETAKSVLGDIRAVSNRSLAEIRVALGDLRGPDAADAITPDVGSLLAGVNELGLEVDTHLDADLDAVQPVVAATAYRIVQEALTNVLRHSGVRQAELRVERVPDGVLVVVRDRGVGPQGEVAPGNGLTGMRERVASIGGHLDAGPADGGGFEVRAVLPVAVTNGASS
ncbi:MAG TPA: sensor histidine kinase, partial [Microthrixaceae bacterium]|nr:sensor histidine kinase [Microthrixaceae bacterium]